MLKILPAAPHSLSVIYPTTLEKTTLPNCLVPTRLSTKKLVLTRRPTIVWAMPLLSFTLAKTQKLPFNNLPITNTVVVIWDWIGMSVKTRSAPCNTTDLPATHPIADVATALEEALLVVIVVALALDLVPEAHQEGLYTLVYFYFCRKRHSYSRSPSPAYRRHRPRRSYSRTI